MLQTVMVCKTPKLNQKGVTLLELILVVGLVVILMSASITAINVPKMRARGRDQKRMSDLVLLQTAIAEFKFDNGIYPDTADTTRISNIIPSGNLGPAENVVSGWMAIDLSHHLTTMPIDPLNYTPYLYTYRHNGLEYELNIKLEYFTDDMLNTNDGGDDDTFYEVGDNLTIL